jgi:hypothetical protein
MPLVPSSDPADRNQQHHDHRILGGNQWMPLAMGLQGARDQADSTVQFLTGGGGDRPLCVDVKAPASAPPGSSVPVIVKITNRGVGCGFPNGDIDVTQAWIELTVRDARQRLVYQSGALRPDGSLPPGTFAFEALTYDGQGRLITRHDFWNTARIPFQRTLKAGESFDAHVDMPIPPGARGPLEVAARLRYRKANQRFMDAVFPRQRAPVVDLAADRKIMQAG